MQQKMFDFKNIPSIYRTLLLASLFVLGACGNAPEETSKRIFRYNESAGITSLDPAFSRSLENIWGVNQLFNSLDSLDSTMNVVPSVAEQ